MQSFNSDNSFELIVHDSPDAILMIDHQLIVCEINRRFCEIFEQPKTFFSGKSLNELIEYFFEGEALDEIRTVLHRLTDGSPLSLKYDLKYRNSHFDVHLLTNTKSKYIYLIFKDVTDYHRALKELRASEHRYRMLSGLTFEGILIHKDARLLDCNASFLEMLGYERVEIEGMDLLELIPLVEDRMRVVENVAQRVHLPYEITVRRKDGTVFPAELEAKNVVYHGEEMRIVAVRNISERKKNERAIQEYQQDLEELVRIRTQELEASNREMEAFTYSVSHDLRAPLRTIAGFAEYLEQDYHSMLDEEGRRYIKVICENASKMDELIVNLLRFSRAARIEPELIPLNMAALARSMYMEVATREEQEVFEFVIEDIPDAYGDLTSIKQVWSNLIDNALKYSTRSVRKRIHIGCSEKTSEFTTYFVKDYGVGFDMNYDYKLFEVFQRLHKDEDFKGTGVGLAIVKRIIEKHQGKVWAESVLGQGSVFYFQLPVTKQSI